MILRPLEAAETVAGKKAQPRPAWSIVEASQSKGYGECWLVPQPAHAALAGEIAAQLTEEVYPERQDAITRAIAMHDAGWGQPDAEQIQRLQAKATEPPQSFLQAPLQVVIAAWEGSIRAADKLGPEAGSIVGRHFSAIGDAQIQGKTRVDAATLLKFMEQERNHELRRMKKVAAKAEMVSRWLEALQFCDLLSLYLCCGGRGPAEFTVGGRRVTLHARSEEEFELLPTVLGGEKVFQVAALRHPRGKVGASRAVRFQLR